jgi:hypothetical protein
VLAGIGQWGGREMGGVAYAAHAGGFAAGLLLVRLFAPGSLRPRPGSGLMKARRGEGAMKGGRQLARIPACRRLLAPSPKSPARPVTPYGWGVAMTIWPSRVAK